MLLEFIKMKLRYKKKGNSLIEGMGAIFVVSIGILIISKASISFYAARSNNEEIKKILNKVEIFEKEVKYNTTLCEMEKLFKEDNKVYISEFIDFEKNITQESLLKNLNKTNGEISLEKVRATDTGIEFLIKIEKVGYDFEKTVKKEKWMEMQGIHID